eukprot:scaffold42465_cov36-Phaeocystis_antarctica.AAC.1
MGIRFPCRPVPEYHPGSDQPGSTERSTWSGCLPKEPHAQRSWPPSAVTASTAGGIGDQKIRERRTASGVCGRAAAVHHH